MSKESSWSYKNLQVTEGLKPGSKHFQYFFTVKEGANKKCNYCVWIDDEDMGHFAPLKSFEEVTASNREEWTQWVRGKIDQGDFRNLVLRLGKAGAKEINLSEMEEKLKPR